MSEDWNLSCPDWEDRLRRGLSLMPALPHLNVKRAEIGTRAFDRLRLADVPGNPRLADACGPWFREIVYALHGSYIESEQERYIREVFCLVPKKNSKTSYGAGLMLSAFLLNKRPKGPFGLVGPTQDITEIAFSQIDGMIKLDPGLDSNQGGFLHVQGHIKRVTDLRYGSTLEVMSFDPAVLTGQKWAGILVDEMHVLGPMLKGSSAIGQVRGGLVAYPEAFLMFITTQSDKQPAGVFQAELLHARAVREGKAKGRLLQIMYELPHDIAFDKNEEWRNTDHWRMVTPNEGRSVTVSRLIQDFQEAQEKGAEEIQRWASQHLNIEIGVSIQSNRWAGSDYWEAQKIPLTLRELINRCEVIAIGIDGGGMDDLLGMYVIGREYETEHWLGWGHAWAHPKVYETRKLIAGRLKDFEMAGDLTICQLPEDIRGMTDMVHEIDSSGKLIGVGIDPWAIGDIVFALDHAGVEDERRIGVSQGFSLQGAIKTSERKLADGTFFHADQDMMTWQVGNAKVEPKGNAVMVTKQASGQGKIDCVSAKFNAVTLLARNPATPRSKYETENLLIL